MRSVVLDFDERRLFDVETGEPEVTAPDHVLFRIHEVGVCGTDRELAHFRVRPRERDSRRLVLGHEALGQVIACGRAVENLRPGDWVVPTIRRGCPANCDNCARGRTDLCLTFGYSERGIFNLDGYFTQYAVDRETDLVRVPPALAPWAVLLEPLSVVEKAVARVEAVRQSPGRNALVLGLGTIGILTAMALSGRGYHVTVFSQEPEDHPRVAILAAAGAKYTRTLGGRWDVIVEAAGAAGLAMEAIRLLGSCGILVTLGAQRAVGEFSFIDMIAGNQALVGVVNASRGSFESGVADLAGFPERALQAMIRRFGFGEYRRTLLDSPGSEPKFVHVVGQ